MDQLPWNLIWTHLSYFLTWDGPPCLSILSLSLSRDTSCCVFTASPCPGHQKKQNKTLKEHIKWEFRRQLPIRPGAFLLLFFFLQLCNVAGQWCRWPSSCSEGLQQQSKVDYSHGRQRSEDRVSAPYLQTYTRYCYRLVILTFKHFPAKGWLK